MIPQKAADADTAASKPRASGDDPARLPSQVQARRVNPARAGMIRPICRLLLVMRCKPRASGDDPAQDAYASHPNK